jgi:hypothetical protein
MFSLFWRPVLSVRKFRRAKSALADLILINSLGAGSCMYGFGRCAVPATAPLMARLFLFPPRGGLSQGAVTSGEKPMNAIASQMRPQGAHWTLPEAFVAIPTIVAVSNTKESAMRLRAVHAFVQRSPFLAGLGEQGLVQIHADAVNRIAEGGGNALEQACTALPSQMRSSMYAACFDILCRGGVLSPRDRELANLLAELLHIEAGLAQNIENVLLVKNRF